VGKELAPNQEYVSAEIVGTFYRAPAPGESPFVQVGETVEIGQTLCIIEAMKVMNEIESPIRGKVIEVLVDNSEPVEFGQPLFVIEKM
jgi:acetyl-CoA carboxylase biotin carboxyl carrier protein